MAVERCAVTVVVPTRDRWSLLGRTALRAALCQEDVDHEVVLVDDGSTEPPEPGSSLADHRIRIVRHDTSRGLAAARNSGISQARGEWIAFLDDDDLWAPTKLREQLAAAAAAGAGFAYSGAVWVDERLNLIYGHAPPPAGELARMLLRWNVLWGGASNVLVHRDLLRALGGFDERFSQLADWDLWIRLARMARGVALPQVHVALLVHGGSMLLTDRRDVFLELEDLAVEHAAERAAAGVELDRARFARWVAAGHLRAGRRLAAARAYVRGSLAPGNVARAAASVLGPGAFAVASERRGALPRALGEGERVAARPDWLELYR